MHAWPSGNTRKLVPDVKGMGQTGVNDVRWLLGPRNTYIHQCWCWDSNPNLPQKGFRRFQSGSLPIAQVIRSTGKGPIGNLRCAEHAMRTINSKRTAELWEDVRGYVLNYRKQADDLVLMNYCEIMQRKYGNSNRMKKIGKEKGREK
ncbi:hypothetical protein PoB_003679500 [Plakobranchus ocellatus]|uniref:Uncharacterized protein n=1 Tax=Plakobranchus ocellatus TaxID=259542 RepID=A0AAV4ATQ5_9GAST|nr:hypothetical protein PoB_003679500 [Plakobranchus ocellatus]